jgi:hypothetical protein
VKTKEKALFDSRATHNLIDKRMAKRLGIALQRMKNPQRIQDADFSKNKNGSITHYTNLEVSRGRKSDIQCSYLTSLGEDQMIFGFPWCLAFQPDIDWKNRKVLGDPTTLQQTTANVPWAHVNKLTLVGQILTLNECHKGDEVWVQVNKTNMVQQWAEKAQKGQKVNTEKDVPLQYLDFKDIFSEEVAKRFPPERDDNHKINFTNDALKTFPCKIYPILKPETEFLYTWVHENLEKKFIRESKSPYTCPTFFIKKKNGDYCIIQDYWQLNQFMVPNAMPLPLITSLIEKLHGKTLFTKFDIQSGYHNIWIKDGDQHKAGFKTSEGQFKLMVMNFGL